MQTFLPYPDYYQALECLDDRRLRNQVFREGKTLINGKWPHHPASKMWRGHYHHLALYCLEGLRVLRARGRAYPEWEQYYRVLRETFPDNGPPPWLGDERLHSSHRANLLRKDPDWHSQFGWTEEPTEGYWWPV